MKGRETKQYNLNRSYNNNPAGVHVGRRSLLLDPQASAHTLALQEVRN